ncbi:MAG: hypothetical protein ACP5E4_01285 [Candidatus Aenigmatarchaeota archaeon]
MNLKTERKLNKRELMKPKHHIDTYILIESMSKGNARLKVLCKRYLNLVGYKYKGSFSLSMVGEFFVKVMTEVDDDADKELLFRSFYDLVKDKQISFYTPKELSLPPEIVKLDARVGHTDASIVAGAIEDNAALVTLDGKLLHNKRVEQKYNIKILSPEEIITSPS